MSGQYFIFNEMFQKTNAEEAKDTGSKTERQLHRIF